MSAQEERLKLVVSGWQERGKWPHALLLSGASGPSLLQLAMKLAKTRLCHSGTGCGHCDSCRVFAAGNHLDFHVLASRVTAEELGLHIDTEGPTTTRRLIRKEQVSATLRQLSLCAQRDQGWRVLLLVNPEELHSASANALLKSLEEPGERVFFILISNQPRAVLETIISRCQQLALPPPTRDELTTTLIEDGCDPTLAQTLAELQRRGLYFAESDFTDRRQLIVSWLTAIANNRDHQRLLSLDQISKDQAPDQILELALSLTLDLMRLQSGMPTIELTHRDLANQLSELAPAGPWINLSQTLAAARPALKRNLRLSSLLMGATI